MNTLDELRAKRLALNDARRRQRGHEKQYEKLGRSGDDELW